MPRSLRRNYPHNARNAAYLGNYHSDNLYYADNSAYAYRGNTAYAYPERQYVYDIPRRAEVRKLTPKRKKKAKLNPLKALISFAFLALVSYYIIPYNFSKYVEPMILNRVLNRNIEFKAEEYVMPTLHYLANADMNGTRVFVPVRHSKKQMVPLVTSNRMFGLENELRNLASRYPNIKPSIYVWDYTGSRNAEINANDVYPSASIIKLPVLIELFRRSESLKNAGYKPVDLDSKLLFDEIHKASGSGYLQYYKTGGYYTIDYLAKIMIQSSDNSATNMLLDEIGGMDALNAASRKWGLTSTQMTSWLPDLSGTNTISAKDMATLLNNIDNPKFLNDNSRYMIKQYMSNVHNRALLQAGLPKEAELLHKTGDIGKMLGDAGIVYAPNGRKYIAVVLTERPHNDYSARDFIQEASRIIYKYVIENPNVY